MCENHLISWSKQSFPGAEVVVMHNPISKSDIKVNTFNHPEIAVFFSAWEIICNSFD